MTEPVSMPLSKWPARDRELWLEVSSSLPSLDASPIAMWQGVSKKAAASAYGVWLQWLASYNSLNDSDPAARLTPSTVKAFAKHQIARGLSMTTVADRLGRLVAVVSGICPDSDLKEVCRISNRVERVAKKQTRPKGYIVHARRMYDLGFDLMAAGRAAGNQTAEGATLFVDGLVIAMLTACPIRIGNFSRLRLDREIVRDNNRWRLLVPGKSTKTSKPEIRFVPEGLASFVDEYISVVRPNRVLMRQHHIADEDAFFVGPSGRPLRDQMMRRNIKSRTAAAFGTPVCPHSFRKLAVTTLVLERPEHAASAPMLLVHHGAKTSEDHYIIGQQVLALEHYHKSLKKAEKQPGLGVADKPSDGAL